MNFVIQARYLDIVPCGESNFMYSIFFIMKLVDISELEFTVKNERNNKIKLLHKCLLDAEGDLYNRKEYAILLVLIFKSIMPISKMKSLIFKRNFL